MNQPGKPRFNALEQLVSDTKNEQGPVTTITGKNEAGRQESKGETSASEHAKGKTESEKRVPRIPNKDELSEEKIIEIAREAATKATLDKLYGRRASYKGPRVTRSYKIELEVDKWLDEMQQKTGIEKSTFVINAVRYKLEQEYPHLKPKVEEGGGGE
jgi:hypothetical protein